MKSARASASGLGKWQATALAVSFVVGVGILVLPMLAVEASGPRGSLIAWIAMTIFAVPLIAVFSKLGREHFRDGGVSDYSIEGFGRWSELGVHLCMLSALLAGMPAMVWVTARLIAQFLGLSESHLTLATGAFAHAILAVLCLNNLRPIRGSTRISVVSLILLLATVAAVVGFNLRSVPAGIQLLRHGPTDSPAPALLKTSVLLFFGYIGWESMTLCTRDLENPRRDSPFVYWASFTGVAGLYLLLAVTVSGAMATPRLTGPASAVHGHLHGGVDGILVLLPGGAVLSMLRLLIGTVLLANLNAWILSGSRQLRAFLTLDHLSPRSTRTSSQATSIAALAPWFAQMSANGVGKRAVTLYFLITSALLVMLDLGQASVSSLIAFCNQNWIVLYGGTLAFCARKARTRADYALLLAASLPFLILASALSQALWITAAYLAFSASLAARAKTTLSRQSRPSSTGEVDLAPGVP